MFRNPSQKIGDCQVCGAKGVIVEEHHVYRRSIRPDLRNDPRNKIDVCKPCHRDVTENRAAEEALQQKFYPDPPKFRAKNELNFKKPTMNEAKQMLLSKAKALRFKASNKEREAAQLRKKADDLEVAAKQLTPAA